MIFSPVSDLRLLYKNNSSPSISIYMPTHRVGEETRQDPIRFKNLLAQAEEKLRERNLRTPEIENLLAPAYRLFSNSPFWRHMADGLAMFIAGNFFRYYPLPLRFKEHCAVADQFYLTPLFPLLSGDGSFFILALSQNEVRLLEGTRENVNEIELEDIPENLAETIESESRERVLQFHTRTGGGSRKRPAVFFGQGSDEDKTRQDIIRYFRQIDQGLSSLLRGEQAPLLLAGVEYLMTLYRGLNSYPNLKNDGIPGNPERLSNQELHQRAWEIIGPDFLEEQRALITRYEGLAGTEKASNDIEVILPAAYQGRVEGLLVANGAQLWGKYDPQTSQLQVYPFTEPGHIELIQDAAIQTILNRGIVYSVDPDQIPGETSLAAIFRF